MANNNETTTKFKVDISDLKRAMQDARRITSIANSEFRAVSSSMDDWTKSTDGVSAKLKQLDTTLNAQKAVLNTLSREYAEVVAEQGENSRAAQDLLIRINNQRAAINNTTRDINRWSTALNELQRESNQTERATQSLNNLINRQQNELNELKEKYRNLVLEQGQSTQEARQLATQISNLSGELNENRNRLNNASNAADELDQSLTETEQSAEKAEGGFTVLKGAIANLVAQAITKAVDTLKELVTQANEVDKAINSLEASTGASAKEMKQYESVMKDIYNANYGESYDDVANSISQVIQTMGKLNKTDLKNVTTNGIALRDTFGFEMNESMRAVNSLMDQFGITADEAYNLIAQGAQKGLNQNGDLLDVINEYSVQFKNGGYSANDMFNMLKNGADAGVWSVDKLGDAVKEMGIRFSDGTVVEALNENRKALDLSKKEVNALQVEYNRGGDSAQKAVGKMIDSILNVKDETKRYQLGVSVFGTMWEDLGADAIKSLMSTKGELTSTKKSMDDIKKTKYDDVGSSLQQLGRMFKEEILKPVQDQIMPKLKELVDFAIKNFPEMVQAAKDFVKELKEWIPTLITIGTAIATYMVATKIIAFVEAIKNGTIALKLMSAAQTALNAVMSLNPIGLVVAAIAALVVAFIMLWKKSDAFREFWINLWENIKEGTKVVVDAIGEFFTKTIPNFFKGLINWIKANWDTILVFLMNPFAGLFKYFYENNGKFKAFVDNAINAIKQLPSKVWTWLLNTINKVNTWRTDMIAKAKDTASNFINNVVNFIKNLPSKIWNFLVQTVSKVASWGGNLASKGKEAAKKLFDSIVNKIKNLPSELKSMGSDIVKGLWNGINDMTGWIAKKIKGFGKGVTDGLKKFFKIKSPSRLMAEEVGRYLPEGIALGIDKNAKSVMNSMRNLATNTVGAARSGLSVGAGTGLVRGGVVNNFTQNNYSPKQLSRVDIYRQSKNLLGYAGGV